MEDAVDLGDADQFEVAFTNDNVAKDAIIIKTEPSRNRSKRYEVSEDEETDLNDIDLTAHETLDNLG